MQEKLSNVSASDPLGTPGGRNLFEVSGGTFAGRLAAVLQTSATELKLFQTDNPYLDWSTVQTIDSACDDEPFDACIDAENNLHVVFCEQTTGYLKYRKISYSAGNWTVESAQTIYNGSASYVPSISIEPDGKLWVAFTIYNSPNRDLYVKASTDSGSTWGSGPADLGELIQSGYMYAYPRLLTGGSETHLFYNGNYSYIAYKTIPFSQTTWSSATLVASGGSINVHYDVAFGPNGVIGVAWADLALKYREFDGASWGAVEDIDPDLIIAPQVIFRSGYPTIIYLAPWSAGNYLTRFSHRQSGAFTTPAEVGLGAGLFQTVLLYDSGTAQYEDLTLAAAESTAADVYHSQTGTLLKDLDEAVYLGHDRPFRALQAILSTSGSGGVVEYSYWNGSSWQSFTPSSGNSNLDIGTSRILLWEDFSEVPADWQMTIVNGEKRFWVRLKVTGAFTTGPVGSNLVAYPYLYNLSFIR